MASPPRRRLALGRTSKRLGYERRMRLVLWLFSIPLFALIGLLLYQGQAGTLSWIATIAGVLLGWALLQAWLAEQLLRPLQTLANVVAALREEDYSFRARGARRGDALGDLALEINALAADLQAERLTSLESAALVRRVLGAIDAPVFSFDLEGRVRLLNPAAARLLKVSAQSALGQEATALHIENLLEAEDEQVMTLGNEASATQWLVNRSSFRQHGEPHTLVLLSDVSVALRQEERLAWQRLIRVLGHEINNSLTPIKSLAGTLRQMLRTEAPGQDFDRPLEVIEERAESLNHFLAAYRQLAQLPPPRRQAFSLNGLLQQLAQLETRLPIEMSPGPELTIHADKDQLGQALINLLRNAAEAALDNHGRAPELQITCTGSSQEVVVRIIDSGMGIANTSNLFVPFYTTKQNGTGIGLVLVKNIIEAHLGTIRLTNHPEGGAVAEIRLPL